MSKRKISFEDVVHKAARLDDETVTVDLSDILGEGAVFKYRRPSVKDAFAVQDDDTINDWRLKYKDIPVAFIQTLELIGRCHLEPQPENQPVGVLYKKLFESLPLEDSLAVIARISEAMGISSKGPAEIVERKKGALASS